MVASIQQAALRINPAAATAVSPAIHHYSRCPKCAFQLGLPSFSGSLDIDELPQDAVLTDCTWTVDDEKYQMLRVIAFRVSMYSFATEQPSGTFRFWSAYTMVPAAAGKQASWWA